MPGKVNPVIPEVVDPGRRSGDRQRHRDHPRRRAGPVRAQRPGAADRPQPARLDQAARLRLPPARHQVRRRDRAERGDARSATPSRPCRSRRRSTRTSATTGPPRSSRRRRPRAAPSARSRSRRASTRRPSTRRSTSSAWPARTPDGARTRDAGVLVGSRPLAASPPASLASRLPRSSGTQRRTRIVASALSRRALSALARRVMRIRFRARCLASIRSFARKPSPASSSFVPLHRPVAAGASGRERRPRRRWPRCPRRYGRSQGCGRCRRAAPASGRRPP